MALRIVLTGLTLALMVRATSTRTSFGSGTPAAYGPRPLTMWTVSGLCSRDRSIGRPGPQLSRLYKYYATIPWTVHDRLLENSINRPTLSTVKNDVPVKVSKIAINQLERLPSDNGKFVFQCTTLSTRRSPRQPSHLVPSSRTPARATPSASLAGPREPCDYSEQCVFAQLNGVCTDHLIGDCALEFVRSLDGKTCDKLQTTAGNALDSPARPTANATLPEPLASRTLASTSVNPFLLKSNGAGFRSLLHRGRPQTWPLRLVIFRAIRNFLGRGILMDSEVVGTFGGKQSRTVMCSRRHTRLAVRLQSVLGARLEATQACLAARAEPRAIARWRRNRFNLFKERGIPGPEPSLFSGNFYQFWHQDTIKVMDEWSNTYGDIYGFYNGDAPFLMVKDLELLRRVFIKDFPMFVDRGMVGNMNEAVDHFLDLFEARCREASDGQANACPLLGTLAFDLVAETACGIFLDVQNKPNDEYFCSAKTYVLNVIESTYQRAGQFFSGVKSLVAVTCILERYFGYEPLAGLAKKAEPIVAIREKDPSVEPKRSFASNLLSSQLARPDLLQSLLEAKVPEELLTRREFRERTNDKGDFLMPLKDVACNAAAILTAGFETVSANTSQCVFCLAKYPEVQEKVRKEVNAAYEKYGEFSYDAISDLPYTTQVIFETLRRYSPVIAFTSRQAACDYRYKDMILPKGLNIMACTQQIHMDPRYWDRPEEFDPDRQAFSPEQKESRDPLAFQPYGIGPRNCVGLKLAQLEMKLIVAKLVHRFRLHLGSRHENASESTCLCFEHEPEN
ncbi:hypothetical protein HPB49_019955 [Dermacentor silvarum]|uniref:Uncharacterized protein n=1 Tax=Dermacentor silvarum TaxID=543639 RepID=A0ACB8CSZ2_DERSI|nr:hypothetical protein HPB49_019955 [Dermacentor silvarum]